jgi:hypothetical protein
VRLNDLPIVYVVDQGYIICCLFSTHGGMNKLSAIVHPLWSKSFLLNSWYDCNRDHTLNRKVKVLSELRFICRSNQCNELSIHCEVNYHSARRHCRCVACSTNVRQSIVVMDWIMALTWCLCWLSINVIRFIKSLFYPLVCVGQLRNLECYHLRQLRQWIEAISWM